MDRPSRQERDAQALERFRAGDERAFELLVDAYKDNVHAFVLSYAAPGEAEDLAQEVFLQVYRSLRSYRGDSLFSTWLYSLARNVCLHHLRARYADKRRAEVAQTPDWLEIPDWRPSYEAVLQDEETRAEVRAAVDSLPPQHRAVIVLSRWEELPYEEIARVLDVPVGTVKSRAHNAMVLLAGKLRPLLERPEDRKT